MIELVSQYSVTEIIIFLVIFATAIKGLFSFCDWALEKLKKYFQKQEDENSQDEKINSILETQNIIIKDLNELKNTVEILKKSDRDAIKAYITKEHKFFVREQGWIDDYSLEILEKRFHHYEIEGGNSFILKLMEELRALPHKPE